MHPNLEKRVSVLEQASPDCDAVQFIILVPMCKTNTELTHIRDNCGNHWNRRPDETETAFKDRATSAMPRYENHVAMLFGEVSAMGHWRDTEAQEIKIIQNK